MARRVRPELVNSWIVNNPELIYDEASGVIFCTKCEISVKATQKGNVDRHVNGAGHQGNRKKPEEEFYTDLINFLIFCNIPWSRVSNSAFNFFFNKYICSSCCCICSNKKVPSESLLRKKYLDIVFKNRLKSIYDAIGNNKIWISLDETTDFMGRYVVHLLVMPLIKNVATQPYLIACKVLETVNGATTAQFVIESLREMWGESFSEKINNVLMLCTDSVAYMLRAGRLLKIDFPNMLHITCLAHALNRVAEQVRSQYENVDDLIANVKKIFLKSPNRVKMLKDMYPNLPLPPQPVITRWGTWLKATSYYSKHFQQISNVLNNLNSNEALSIRKAKAAIRNENIQSDLNFIDENYTIIQVALTKLQESNLSVSESLQIIDDVRCVLSWSSNEVIENKLEKVIERNPDYDTIREKSDKILKTIDLDDELIYKFAPLTSVDVERSFSTYKWILSVKRNRLKIENMEKLMVIYFNFLQENNISHCIDSDTEDIEDI